MSDNRSKVSQIPDLVPHAPIPLRLRLMGEAAAKAWKAYRRHGERSHQFVRASQSRWLKHVDKIVGTAGEAT